METSNPLVSVKWMGPNTPIIHLKRNGMQVLMTKKELVALHAEISNFMHYYSSSFTDERINYTDDPENI